MAKEAWVTVVTNDTYGLGALVLGSSLRRVSTSRDTVVMVTPGVSERMREVLGRVFTSVVPVDILDSGDSANLALMSRPELGVTFTKLHAWTLVQYSKCVFLDADTLVIQNSDELFEREELSAVPDPGWPDCFNSGVFVFVPNLVTYQALLDFAVAHGSFDGGDQGLLNMFFREWATQDIKKHLSFIYNLVASTAYTYLPALKFFGNQVKIVHFLGGTKPWTKQSESSSLPYQRAWWSIFREDISPHLTQEMTGVAGALARGDTEEWRKEAWEAGDVDYLGRDSFDNIWRRICECVGITSQAPAPAAAEPVQPPVEASAKLTEQTEVAAQPDVAAEATVQPVASTESPVKPVEDVTQSADTKVEPPVLVEGVPQPEVPSLPAETAPQSAESEKVIPPPAVPEAKLTTEEAPQPAAPTEAAPQPAVPAEAAPQPAVPAEAAPQPAVPTESAPQPAVPAEAAPQPAVPAEAAPQVAVPAPETTVPTEAATQPAVPAEATPQPETKPDTISVQSAVPSDTVPPPPTPEGAASPPVVPVETAPQSAALAEATPQPVVPGECAPQTAVPTEAAPQPPVPAESAPHTTVPVEAAPQPPVPAEVTSQPEGKSDSSSVEAAQPVVPGEVAPLALAEISVQPPIPTETQIESKILVEVSPETKPADSPVQEIVLADTPAQPDTPLQPAQADTLAQTTPPADASAQPATAEPPAQTAVETPVATAESPAVVPPVQIPSEATPLAKTKEVKQEATDQPISPVEGETKSGDTPTCMKPEDCCGKPEVCSAKAPSDQGKEPVFPKPERKPKETPKLPTATDAPAPTEVPVSEAAAYPIEPGTPTITPPSGPGSPIVADVPEVCKLQATSSQPSTPPASGAEAAEPPVPPKRKQAKSSGSKGGKK